jgi:hypothetical protein
MSKTELSAGFRLFAFASAFVASLTIFACPAATAALGRTYFFANRDACVASGALGPR